MINKIVISNYRSIRNIELNLSQLNIIFGGNGVGKSNLYNSLRLIHGASRGMLSDLLASEGGIQNVMWAGNMASYDPKRVSLEVNTEEFIYELQIGYPIKLPYETFFKLDPVIKEENLWLPNFSKRPSSQIMSRKNQTVFMTDVNSNKVSYPSTLYDNESVFGQLGEPHLYPEVSNAREVIRNWRFYHEFNISSNSAIRLPQVGSRSPVLASDGSNLAAAFQTIIEVGDGDLLNSVLNKAFPNSRFEVSVDSGRFQILMVRDGLRRALSSSELSDGTLRFLCLTVALLSPRPPKFIVLNEPEGSLHIDMLPALAVLIHEASRFSQVIITSHSPTLSNLLKNMCICSLIEMDIDSGESYVKNILNN